MTATVGNACASVQSRSREFSDARVSTPCTTMTTATIAMMTPATRNPRQDFLLLSGMSGFQILVLRRLLVITPVHDAENDGHEEQRGHRREKKSADHRAA